MDQRRSISESWQGSALSKYHNFKSMLSVKNSFRIRVGKWMDTDSIRIEVSQIFFTCWRCN